MRNEHPLYTPFLQSIQNKSTTCLHLFKEPTFWQVLSEEEKKELASLFLLRAEEALEEKNAHQVTEYSRFAEEIAGERHDVLFHITTLLYRQGVFTGHKESLLLALGKMVQIEENTPEFLESDYKISQHWGNLLVALHRMHPDDAFLEQAIQKYEKALTLVDKKEGNSLAELYWDLGDAFLHLGKRSCELADLKQAEMAFAHAARFGLQTSHFWIDYADVLFQMGHLLGEPDYLHKANAFYKSVITRLTDLETKEEASHLPALSVAWVQYALASKKIVELTHDDQEFQEADRIFQEALSSVPGESALWLHWGELFLRFGWVQKELAYLDRGLEKLTALKTSECDPFLLSAFLTEGLVLLGLCIEDLTLIKEGEKRIHALLAEGKEHPGLTYAAGVCAYAKGVYFADEKSYLEALDYFETVLEEETSHLFARHLIFEVGMALADIKGEAHFAKKSIEAIGRAATLAPKVPLFWNEWGIALVKWHVFESKPTLLLEQAIEKFKKAISLNEENPDPRGLFHYGIALDLLGAISEDEKNYEKAIEILSLVQEKVPDALTVRTQLALAHFHLGELTGETENHYRAIDLFESVLAIDREDEAAWCALGCALLNLSELVADPIHKDQEEELKQKAANALMRAAEWGNLEANYHLACLYSLSGKLEKSMEYLLKASHAGALPEREDLLEDEWLENVRTTEEFRIFYTRKWG